MWWIFLLVQEKQLDWAVVHLHCHFGACCAARRTSVPHHNKKRQEKRDLTMHWILLGVPKKIFSWVTPEDFSGVKPEDVNWLHLFCCKQWNASLCRVGWCNMIRRQQTTMSLTFLFLLHLQWDWFLRQEMVTSPALQWQHRWLQLGCERSCMVPMWEVATADVPDETGRPEQLNNLRGLSFSFFELCIFILSSCLCDTRCQKENPLSTASRGRDDCAFYSVRGFSTVKDARGFGSVWDFVWSQKLSQNRIMLSRDRIQSNTCYLFCI